MEIISRQLPRRELDTYRAHLLALEPEDRRLRFGHTVDDATIRAYVARIDTERDALFGVTDGELTLVGAAHVARGARFAELGISVLAGHRRRGIGAALLRRAQLHARNRGLPEFVTHCLRENVPFVRLARRHGMTVVAEDGEADGFAALAGPDAGSLALELIAERVGRFDHLLKSQTLALRQAAARLA